MKPRLPAVEAAIAESVAITIAQEMADPRVRFATVTRVKVSPDLHSAQVFVSVFGSEQQQRAAIESLHHAAGFIQSRVAKSVRMKRTPHLVFVLDDSTEQAVRVTRLIQEAIRKDQEK